MHRAALRTFAISLYTIGAATMIHAQQSGPLRKLRDMGKYCSTGTALFAMGRMAKATVFMLHSLH